MVAKSNKDDAVLERFFVARFVTKFSMDFVIVFWMMWIFSFGGLSKRVGFLPRSLAGFSMGVLLGLAG